MPRVIVEPIPGGKAEENYKKTVEKTRSLEKIRGMVANDDFEKLVRFHPSGAVRLWGAIPDDEGKNRRKWKRISSGDVLLFTGNGEVFAVATVTHAFESEELARDLWGPETAENGRERYWQLLFALTHPVPVRLSYDEIDKTLVEVDGRRFPYRSFNVLEERRSAKILALLDAKEIEPVPIVGAQSSDDVVRELDAVDGARWAKYRKEQGYLRQFLLRGDGGTCALCGRRYPGELLVAAHIKKRSQCEPEEKRDIPAIAMLACRFGCDELYERHMIVVSETGEISDTPQLPTGAPREYFEATLHGRSVDGWDEIPASHKYFSAHRAAQSA